MPAIVLYFQVHQPYRLRPYTVFDLGENHLYEDWNANCDIVRKVGENAYLPMNALLLELIREYKGAFKVKALDLALLLCSGATTSTCTPSIWAMAWCRATIPGA